MATVSFKRATRIYPGQDRPAVDDLDLEIDDGEFLVLVGPSGCGKSTTLRMLAGLEPTDDGEIWIGDDDVTSVQPKDRDIAMVFQSYALYPHMTVAENIGFHLKVKKVGKKERAARVREAARILDLEEYLDRKPSKLSGGQRQRVAMGRAIVREPKVFLMDEPLSNLDAKLRVSTRTQIAALQRRLGVTTVYVTHDQIEAMTMGDRVAVMNDGVLQQCATPRELFTDPVNVFVAGFIGSPAMNIVTGTVDERGADVRHPVDSAHTRTAQRTERRHRDDRHPPQRPQRGGHGWSRCDGRRRGGTRVRGVPLLHRLRIRRPRGGQGRRPERRVDRRPGQPHSGAGDSASVRSGVGSSSPALSPTVSSASDP